MVRYVTVALDQKDYYRLLELKARWKSKNWADFIKQLLKKAESEMLAKS